MNCVVYNQTSDWFPQAAERLQKHGAISEPVDAQDSHVASTVFGLGAVSVNVCVLEPEVFDGHLDFDLAGILMSIPDELRPTRVSALRQLLHSGDITMVITMRTLQSLCCQIIHSDVIVVT